MTFGVVILSEERDAMIKSLKQQVIPTIRERGFKGSFPTFIGSQKINQI